MGFYVGVESNESAVLRNLRENPAEVFGNAYGGYLLFLMGSADEEALTWLATNALALDSLTGEHVAFGVFARHWKVKLHVSGVPKPDMPQGNRVVDVPLNKIRAARSITTLVKSGECGWVLNGDEINAITYGTDDVARAFGVLDELPCLLVMDSVPKREYELVHLDSKTLQALVGILRRSVQSLISATTYPQYMASIRKIIQLQEASEANEDRLGQLREATQRLESRAGELELASGPVQAVTILDPRQDSLPGCRHFLRAGQLSRFVSRCQKYRDKSIIDEEQFRLIVASAKGRSETLLAYTRAIHALYIFSSEHKWPLEEPWRSRYVGICTSYVRPLLGDMPENLSLEFPAQSEMFRMQLIGQQTKIIDEIMAGLPGVSAVRDRSLLLLSKEKDLIGDQLEDLNVTKRGIETQLKTAVAEIYQAEQPSFIRCFMREIQKEQMKSVSRRVRDAARTFAGSWLRPETIVDIWKSFTTP
jgi:hypothetical protein